VLAKEDEPGENPMYGVPKSGKDETGARRDWYPRGDSAERGPYDDPENPSGWSVNPQSDMYFRIITKTQ